MNANKIEKVRGEIDERIKELNRGREKAQDECPHNRGGYIDGVNVFDAKNDRGYDWWTTDGKLVLEDPEYCASVSFTVGSWIEMLTKYSGK